MNIGFTGHRRKYLIDNIDGNIYNFLDKYLLDNKEVVFHLGGANGFDNIVGEYAVNNNIPYILHLPFENIQKQVENWNKKEISILENLISKAEDIIYYNGYFERNRGIVNNSEKIVCYFNKNFIKSGTAYTYKYALQKGKKIDNLYYNK